MRLPFPYLILVTPIKVYAETPGENGVTEELIFDGKCNFSEKSRTTLNEQKQVVELTGRALFEGDIHPGKPIRGFVMVGDVKKTIYRIRKPRNPDGSIFSTELDLM